jgi:hypothetical protein
MLFVQTNFNCIASLRFFVPLREIYVGTKYYSMYVGLSLLELAVFHTRPQPRPGFIEDVTSFINTFSFHLLLF